MANQTTTIPKGWKMTTLGEVATTVTDFVANGSFASLKENVEYNYKEDYAVMIRLADYNNNFSNLLYTNKKGYEFLKKSSLNPRDIIISNVGEYSGTVFRAPNLNRPMTLAPNSILVRFDNDSDDYFYFLLKSKNGQSLIDNIKSGSANPKFNKTDFKKIEVIIPQLPEQRAIAAVLSSLDDKIELLREQNKTLEATAQAIFKEWFVNFNFPGTTGKMIDSELGEIPEGWRVGKFGDIFKIEYGRSDKKFDKDGNFPVYGAGGIVGYSNSTDYQGYQVIVGCRGTCGNVTLAYVDSKITHNSLIINNEWFKPYSYLFLQTIDIKRAITGSTQPQITIGDLGNIQIYIPEDRLIKLFSENINSVFEKISNNNSQIETLSKIRDTLLPKLMKGDVRVAGFNK